MATTQLVVVVKDLVAMAVGLWVAMELAMVLVVVLIHVVEALIAVEVLMVLKGDPMEVVATVDITHMPGRTWHGRVPKR